jgi:hypothetical protein
LLLFRPKSESDFEDDSDDDDDDDDMEIDEVSEEEVKTPAEGPPPGRGKTLRQPAYVMCSLVSYSIIF